MQNKRRLSGAIIAAVMLIALVLVPMFAISASAAETGTATITFDSTSKRSVFTTTQQIWKEGDITVTNDKGSSSSNVADYANPARFYKDSTLTIKCAAGKMTKLVFTCSGSSYAKAPTGLSGATASASGTTLTITLTNAVEEFSFRCNGSQLRVNKLVVTYEVPEVEPDAPAVPDCEHANTTTTTVDATCTKAGSTTEVCDDCHETVSGSSIAALGHDYEIVDEKAASCTEDGYVLEKCATCGDEKETAISAGHKYVDGKCSVCQESAPVWKLTDIADIKETDVVIITMTNAKGTYAISNNNGTGAAPTAVLVTVADDLLEVSSSENLEWNIASSDAGYIIYVNGTTSKWLYSTNTNNGLRVGTNTDKTFAIDEASGYLKHVATKRYVGIYDSQDWRGYTSINDNIKNQTLAFYVLAQAPACDHENKTLDSDTATCTQDGVKTYTCECGETVTETSPAKGHTPGAAADCVNDQTCTVCDEKLVDALGHNYVDGACTVCGVRENPDLAALIGAKVNVGVNLAIKYLVYLPEGTDLTKVILKVTNEGHNTCAELEGTLLEGNTYEFIYDNIAPQCMSDLLDAYLIIEGETVAFVEDYSIVQNAKNLAAAEDATDELKQFLADLIAYGKAAQEYINSEVVITDEDIAAIGTPSKNAPDASVYTDPAEPTAPEQAYISGAGVRFDSQLQIFVVVTGDAAASATVEVAGFDGEYAVELGKDGYTVYLPGMSMTQISEALEITLYVDGKAVHTISYGAYAYVYKMLSNEDTDVAMENLAKALYNCAESAKYYLTKE